MTRLTHAACAAILAACAGAASAHTMGVVYTLPIPFWMYAYGASAALVVSFLIVGWFVHAGVARSTFATRDLSGSRVFAWLGSARVVGALRIVSVALAALAIVAGFIGTSNPFRNFNMTFFWIVFMLGFGYLTALVGNLYAVVNPWRVIIDWIERAAPQAFRPRIAYPAKLATYPALALYMAFIWLELFGHTRPFSLSVALVVYSAITFAGAFAFGKDAWLRHGEFFGVFFRLIALVAPFEAIAPRERAGRATIRLRWPFSGLVGATAAHPSELLFVLFMLSSTAYDGIHETLPWVRIYWAGLYPLLSPYVATQAPNPYFVLVDIFYWWQWAMMVVSPFVYLAAYVALIGVAKLLTRTELSVRALALRFAYSLIPIAFVYNVTHYYTLLATQGINLVPILSDPFGFGWNLFGTARLAVGPVVLAANSVWHTQVALILAGHIASVCIAHLEAIRIFPSRAKATLSQLPMLVLMVLFTTAGLWILSLPIAAGQLIDPSPAVAPAPLPTPQR